MVEAFFAISKNNKFADKDIGSEVFSSYTSDKLNLFRKQIRNNADAILVGANTIIKDNPTLLNEKRENIRIVIDKYNNLPYTSKIFNILPEKTYILALKTEKNYINKLQKLGVNILKVNENELLETIKSLSIDHLLIEGGVKTLEFFSKKDYIDRFIVVRFPFYLPKNSISFDFEGLKKLKSHSLIFDKIYELIYYENKKNDFTENNRFFTN